MHVVVRPTARQILGGVCVIPPALSTLLRVIFWAVQITKWMELYRDRCT
ncbi:MAG: hypothetical protein RMJ19_05385 [Gemmatales bacterium]|nr:hypothetical protein [Gemmatales bacterium]MDW8175086.1 hypothetical protein [Gemmatales bacterium]